MTDGFDGGEDGSGVLDEIATAVEIMRCVGIGKDFIEHGNLRLYHLLTYQFCFLIVIAFESVHPVGRATFPTFSARWKRMADEVVFMLHSLHHLFVGQHSAIDSDMYLSECGCICESICKGIDGKMFLFRIIADVEKDGPIWDFPFYGADIMEMKDHHLGQSRP